MAKVKFKYVWHKLLHIFCLFAVGAMLHQSFSLYCCDRIRVHIDPSDAEARIPPGKLGEYQEC